MIILGIKIKGFKIFWEKTLPQACITITSNQDYIFPQKNFADVNSKFKLPFILLPRIMDLILSLLAFKTTDYFHESCPTWYIKPKWRLKLNIFNNKYRRIQTIHSTNFKTHFPALQIHPFESIIFPYTFPII